MISNVKVLVGPESDDGKHRWYFSLNNRRLYVLKRCREEGLLKGTNNLILVRVREPKSQSEIERYTVTTTTTTTMMMMMMMMMRLTTVIPGVTRRKVNTQIASTHSFDNFFTPNIAAYRRPFLRSFIVE
jgi:uncharacterized membrane protein